MITPKTRVRTKDGKIGVVGTDLPSPMNFCGPNEVPVFFDGDEAGHAFPHTELEILESENAIPDPKRCGAGLGANCCIWLVAGGNGFECARFTPLHFTLLFRRVTMSAKRMPIAAYPACMHPIPLPSSQETTDGRRT